MKDEDCRMTKEQIINYLEKTIIDSFTIILATQENAEKFKKFLIETGQASPKIIFIDSPLFSEDKFYIVEDFELKKTLLRERGFLKIRNIMSPAASGEE